MVDKKFQALKRLVKKLSALRATLRKEERDLLDELIVGRAAEVEGHSMNAAATKASKTARMAEVAARTASEMIEFDEAAKAYRVKAA